MRGRRVRARRPLLRPQYLYVYNGVYPQRVLLTPALSRTEFWRRVRVLAVAVPAAFASGFAPVVLVATARGGLR